MNRRQIGTTLAGIAALLAMPTLLQASTNGTLAVSWQPSSATDLAGYTLYWGTQSGNYTSSQNLSSSATSRTFTGLETTLTYYFALRAVDLAGNQSTLSLEAWAQPRVSVGALPAITECEDALTSTPYLMQCAQRSMRVSGSSFQSGAAVTFTDGTVTVASTSFSSSAQLTASVRPSASTIPGVKEVRVTNPDSGTATISGAQSVEVIRNPDFSRNALVGAEDFNLLAIAFGSRTGESKYNAAVDMNANGVINGDDLTRFTLFLGKTVTPCP